MNRSTGMFFSIVLALALIFGPPRNACATSIGEIIEKPDQYYGKTVTVSGKVVETLEFMVKMYGIEDGTGRITVHTNKALPQIESQVQVSGKVTEGISREAGKYPVISEESRQ